MIVSFVSQKGGVGKSGLSRLLAVEFAKAGWSVKIADLDAGQGSTTSWKARRDQNNIEPEIPVEKYNTVERAARDAESYDLMILDGRAFAEKGGLEMARISDLVIIPARHSLDDLEPQVQTAYDLEGAGIDPSKIVFVFALSDASESEDSAARDYLKRARLEVLDPVFPHYPSIRLAHNEGKAASEVGHPKVQEKVIAVAQSVANKLEDRK